MKKYFIFLLPIIFLTAFGSVYGQKEITWYSLEEAQQLAKENDKKVLVYAEAAWCTYCKKMEKEVFPKQKIIESLAKYYYPVRLDIESDKKLVFNGETMTGSQFAQEYRVRGTPTIFFIDKEGKILGAQPGFIPAEIFNSLLAFVGTDAHKNTSFEAYSKQN